MKKLYLFGLSIALLFAVSVSAQTYSETEPNNSFATANTMNVFDTITGSVGGADAIDYFRPDINFWTQYEYATGSLFFYITATNNGAAPATMDAKLYNGLHAAGQVYSSNFPTLAPGASTTYNFSYCGQYVDDFILSLASNGNISYKLKWYFSDANPNHEPNNSRASALEFDYGLDPWNVLEDAIRYEYRQNPDTDTVDYFKAYLPVANYNNIQLEIHAKNNSCFADRWIQFAVYKNNSTTPFAAGYVGNNQHVSQYEEIFSAAQLNGMMPGDSLFVKIWSNAAFGYTLGFSDGSVTFTDEYWDLSYEGYDAENLAPGQTIVAQVGYHVIENGSPLYDEWGEPVIDNYDSYEVTLPADGEILLFMNGRNDECASYLNVEMEASGSTFYYPNGYIIEWYSTCNEEKSGYWKIKAVMAGTYRFRVSTDWSSSGNRTSYSISYNFVPYSTGSTDDEPNYNVTYAVPINESETKNGYLNYISQDSDYSDYYKTTLDAVSSIKVFLKVRYRGLNKIADNNNRFTFRCINNNFTYRAPAAFNNLTEDQLYLDTFNIASINPGQVNFILFSDEAYEYEFRYEILDTLNWPNDIEPNSTFATAQNITADTTYGRLGFVASPSDQYDYFTTVIPADGRIRAIIEAKHADATQHPGFDRISFAVYDGRKSSGEIFERYVGNVTSIPMGQTVYDTIDICGFVGDTVYFRFYSQIKFLYKFSFELKDTVVNNIEPNNSIATSTPIRGMHTQKGTVGYYKRGALDNNDYYKVVFGSKDTLKVNFKAVHKGCAPAGIRIYGYNKSQSQLFNRFMGSSSTLVRGEMVEDSISLNIAGIDTIYLRLESSTAFEYEFTTGPLVPNSRYSITGDSTVCFGPQVYKAVNITEDDISYHWSLPAGGGTISFVDSIATVNWNQSSNRIVQLVLSNYAGSSTPRQREVIVNNSFPSQVPVAYNFARNLSTNTLPPGSSAQWFRDHQLIPGATDTAYYAALAGAYTVKFVNDCGQGPESNEISFPGDAQSQVVTFTQLAPIPMSPTAKVKLNATSTSGLPVFYQLLSGNGSIVNDTLYINQRGNFVVKAMQPGDDVYSAATPVNDTIEVIKGDHIITFDFISDKIFTPAGYFELFATSTAGVGISYEVVSGHATIGGKWFYYGGVGTVTVRAFHNGDYNYNAAAPVTRTFCVGVRELKPIAGDPNPCLAKYSYNTTKIPGANFVWTLSSGGTLTTNNDTAFVQWTTPGTHTLKVKANSPCDPVYTDEREYVITTSNNSPAAVSGMLPVNLAQEQQLPLKLSWIPGGNSISYDLYVWDSASAQPATPYKANLLTVSYTLPMNSFAYNTTYKWRIVAKNPCSQTAGPIQHFRLIPLADLMVSEVLAPSTVNSGQTVTISWKVTNVGPGKTLTNQSWTDGVFFSHDTIPDFSWSPNWNPHSWSSLNTPIRPLLLGTKPNVSALNSGEHYTNSITYTIPPNYSEPLYVYVITNYPHRSSAPLQVTVLNDTARAADPIDVILTPTPDLRIDTVYAPTNVFSGSEINLSYKVKNYGALVPAGSSWGDSVFISRSPLFDRNQATPLNFVKQDGSYYPREKKATLGVSTQLQTDSTYNRNMEIVIPNFIFGTWFIYVQTNATKTLYEGALANNNLNRAQLEVYLTPTPKLMVNAINIPVADVSITQPFGINYTIKNEGFNDNIEKNRGHYITMGTCHVSCPGNPPNTICIAPKVQRDSVVFGSSYWIDRIYLSKNPNGLNTAEAVLVNELKHGIQNSGIYDDIIVCPANVSGNVNVHNIIRPGGNYPTSANFNIPADLAEGTYYVYVYPNPTKTVFEYPGTPQIERSAIPIVVKRPDLTVTNVTAPSSSSAGQPVSIQYTVRNDGQGSVFNRERKDRIYTSIWPVFDANAVVVGTNVYTEDLHVGSEVTKTFEYTFAPATTGNRYFYVVTNYDSAFRETTMQNNVNGAPITISAAIPANLIVTAVQPQDTFFTRFNSRISYTVSNTGTGNASGSWTDSVFISCSPAFTPATAYYIGKKEQVRSVASAGTYTDTISLNTRMTYEINNCFAQSMYQNVYFYVKTNADTGIYEASNVNDNVGGSGIRPLINPLVDHIVTKVSGADNATVGRPYQVSWTTKNIGYHPGTAHYQSYTERVYFAPDTIINPNAVVASTYIIWSTIQRGDSVNFTKTFNVPDLLTGDYYVMVKTAYNDGIPGERIYSNNLNFLRNASGQAIKIHIVRPLLSDLVDSVLTAPAMVAVGQPVTMRHLITNKGAGITFPSAWHNELYLSSDLLQNPNDGDRLLKTKSQNRLMNPGETLTDTISGTIPMSTEPGNYVLISKVNSNGAIVESNANNNLGLSLITVYRPEPADLIVSSITNPDTVYLGYTLDTVKWIVSNNSPNPAKGVSRDGIYLTQNNSIDSTSLMIGMLSKNINMDPVTNDTFKLAPLVTGVVEGNYNLAVRTDILNNIFELDKNNNTTVSTTPVYVKVKELALNVIESNTLHTTDRYYKLVIPDSLYGSTIMVTLKTNDSLTRRNEIYIGKEYIPTPANFDYRFENPNYGNQRIVMSDVTNSVYYITVTSANPGTAAQNITLKAEKLPFAILNVNANSGGNGGQVTVRLNGSLYEQGMTAKLTNGITTINASQVYFTNSTVVYATFNLQGQSLGVYDVTLTKQDATTATLEDGFSIVPPNNGGLITGSGPNTGAGNGNEPGCYSGAPSGLNSQLVVEIVAPARGLLGRNMILYIHYNNPTNMDIPAQSRILYSEENMKMAFTREGVPTGTTALYMELIEEGGPPGIIRAGGSGTITVYTVIPTIMPADPHLLFKLN